MSPVSAPPAGLRRSAPRPSQKPGLARPAVSRRSGRTGRTGRGRPGQRRPGQRRPGQRRPGQRRPGILWRYRRVWFLIGLVGFTALAGAVWVITQIPLPSEAPLAQTTLIFDAKGNRVAELHGVENRFPVEIEQVPPITQAAVIAAEDRHFLEHGGIDPWSILRATWADIRSKGAVQGGSTITQQYVKNQIVGSERSLMRKLKEAVVAIKLERKHTKEEILEKYLNTVYFGRGAYGIQAAARTYFKKDVGELDLRESAYLAGLIRTPSAGDVFTDPENAYFLRASVLRTMAKERVITQAEADEVEATKIESYTFAPEKADTTFTDLPDNGSEYFIDYVRQQLMRQYGVDRVLRGGLRVYTTLDPTVQTYAYRAVYDTLDDPDNDPIGALVSLDGEGRVVAMVGNRAWKESQVNVAVGTDGGGGGRQGGSAFKPFVLAEALRQGKELSRYYNGAAKIGPLPGWGEQEVHNYGGVGFGYINLVQATVNSVNTVYAQLVDEVGPENVVKLARDLGITSELLAVPSITLGTQEVSVMEMADAYLTFFRDGTHVDPRVITKVTEGDTVLVEDKPAGVRRALARDVAQEVREVLGQVVEQGSGTLAQIPGGAWGKTGTTDEFGDAWFVGANDKLVTAVWMGYPEGQSRPLRNVQGVRQVAGGTLPAFIFKRFMTKAAPSDGKPGADPVLDVRALNTPAAGASRPPASESATTTAPDGPSPTSTTAPAAPAGPASPAPAITAPAAPQPTAPPATLVAPTIPQVTPSTTRRSAVTFPTITRPPGSP